MAAFTTCTVVYTMYTSYITHTFTCSTIIIKNNGLLNSGEVFEKSYLGSVSSMKLNGYYAAVLHDGRVHLHLVNNIMEIIVTCHLYIYV